MLMIPNIFCLIQNSSVKGQEEEEAEEEIAEKDESEESELFHKITNNHLVSTVILIAVIRYFANFFLLFWGKIFGLCRISGSVVFFHCFVSYFFQIRNFFLSLY